MKYYFWVIISLVLGMSCSLNQGSKNSQKMEKNTVNQEDTVHKIIKTETEWKLQLSPDAFRVLRQNGTEYPFSGKFDKHFQKGTYVCAGCQLPLFKSDTKYNSGCGWPAFNDQLNTNNIVQVEDHSHGMHRIEVRCQRCDGHLGHVFNDGPPPTGLRYCINSVSLDFIPDKAENKEENQTHK